MTDVAGVHDDELASKVVLVRPRVLVRLRQELLRVDPVRDHRRPRGARALGDQPFAHPAADRDHALGTTKVERDRSAEQPDSTGFSTRFSCTAISGKRPG